LVVPLLILVVLKPLARRGCLGIAPSKPCGCPASHKTNSTMRSKARNRGPHGGLIVVEMKEAGLGLDI
jgi:hypothetical protein